MVGSSPLIRRQFAPVARGGPSIKTGHAIEQDRPDVLSQRRTWFDGQLDLDPERLVFIDGSEAEADGDRPGPRPT
jgi:hypothetical protein